MTSRDFCYWLQGFFEIHGEKTAELPTLDQDQVRCIKAHLALVFKHEIDPSAGPPDHQAALNAIHTPPKHPADASKPRPPIGGHGPGGTLYRC